ncbi:patatin-like phospholipase family protein [Legionella micdadei]|uniref:patatin-like phospholipase family protein n=1 Tax=Legionella micdadei TaxID=451 RepID=UPI0009EF6FE5|nr:patatin-like phospholipase family protein [Legionella micdadei]ARG99967.1 hypothetical protein B6V88_05795 [Legionella micdadei]
MIELLDILRKSVLFSCLQENELQDLASKFVLIDLKEGEILFSRGDKPDSIYLVISGNVVSYLIDKNNQPEIIGNVEQGQIVGESGVLSNQPRMLSVKATTPSQLAQLSAERFKALCDNNPVILQETIKIVIERSQRTMNFIADESTQQWHIVIPANSQVSIKNFSIRLKKNLTNYQDISFFEGDDVDNIKEEMSRLGRHKNRMILLINSPEVLSELLELNKNNTIYLLADNQANVDVDLKILNLINNKKNKIYIKSELVILHSDDVEIPVNTIKWLEKASFSFHYQIKQNRDADYQRFLRFINGTATALVLGGGGAKGWFHVGLIKALTEMNIEIDAIGGVSAGAIVGACYLIDPEFNLVVDKLKRITSAFYRITKFKNLTWPLVSLFKSSDAIASLQEIFHEIKIEDLWRPFFCVTANLSMCCESVHYHGELPSLIMASNSIPGVLPPLIINGQLHYDGGLINNLPIDIMRNRIGNQNRIIASSLSTNSIDDTVYHFPQETNLIRFLMARFGRGKKSYPIIWDNFIKAILMGSSLKEQQNCQYADFVINPDLSHFSIYYLNKNQEQELLQLGYEEGIKLINSNVRIYNDRI